MPVENYSSYPLDISLAAGYTRDMEGNAAPNEETKMTDKNVLKLKMVAALLEAIEIEDEEDAKEAVKQIRALLGESK